MIAVDACVVISFLAGEAGPEVDALIALLARGEAILAPSTVTELLSDPRSGGEVGRLIADLKTLPTLDGYWRRAGHLRALIKRAGRKAALGDALLAQACIDNQIALLTQDRDFRAFADLATLRLA